MDFFLLLVTGLVGGFLAGFLGIGGGIIYILVLPAILTSFNLPEEVIAQYTIANSIFGILFASLAGSVMQLIHKNFFKREAIIVSISSALTAVLVLHFIVNTAWYSRTIFNFVIIIVLIYLLISTLKRAKLENLPEHEISKSSYLGFAGIGSGALSALSGLGGGAIVVPVLNGKLKMNIQKAKSISLSMIFFTALLLTIANLLETPIHSYEKSSLGYVIFPVAIPLSLGVSLASPLGVKISSKLKPRIISYIFAIFLLIVIIFKVFTLIRIM